MLCYTQTKKFFEHVQNLTAYATCRIYVTHTLTIGMPHNTLKGMLLIRYMNAVNMLFIHLFRPGVKFSEISIRFLKCAYTIV